MEQNAPRVSTEYEVQTFDACCEVTDSQHFTSKWAALLACKKVTLDKKSVAVVLVKRQTVRRSNGKTDETTCQRTLMRGDVDVLAAVGLDRD